MIISLVLVFLQVTQGQRYATPHYRAKPSEHTPEDRLMHADQLAKYHNIHDIGGAEHRGFHWYDYKISSSDVNSASTSGQLTSRSVSDSSMSDTFSSSESSEASSFETKEQRAATEYRRVCAPCPEDMLKKYTNIGIEWVCGSYQRARRSFKSVCMMKYRNCQDGTMFVKLYNHKCRNDTHFGKSWFYDYRV